MSAQTVSWNHLETLLNEATLKRTTVTPKSKTIAFDEGSHPHILKCIRYKKNRKEFYNSSQSSKYKEPITSVREKTGVETFVTPVKPKKGMVRAQTTTKIPQKSSLQHLDQLSDGPDEVKDFLAGTNIEPIEAPQYRGFGSVETFEGGSAARWSDIPRGRVYRQSCAENMPVVKRFDSICGLEDFQLRELYRLKCQVIYMIMQ